MPLSAGRCYQRLAFGPSGVIAASVDGLVHLLDSRTGELLDSIEAHEGSILEMHWCPRLLKLPGGKEPGAVLATCGRDKRVRLWTCP
jgi:WD40 repeat protein